MNIENNNIVCQTRDILDVVVDYTYALDTLDTPAAQVHALGQARGRDEFPRARSRGRELLEGASAPPRGRGCRDAQARTREGQLRLSRNRRDARRRG